MQMRKHLRLTAALTAGCLVLGANGVEREITPPMTDDEIARFQKSGEALRSVIDQMAL